MFTEKDKSQNRIISVIVEPRSDYTDAEAVALLKSHGAKNVEVICTGFVSARIQENTIPLMKDIGTIHKKTRHTPFPGN